MKYHLEAPPGAARCRPPAPCPQRVSPGRGRCRKALIAILAAGLALLAMGCGRKANPGLRIGVVGLGSANSVGGADGEGIRVIEALRQASAGPSEIMVLSDPAFRTDLEAETAACLERGATVLAVCLGDPRKAASVIDKAKAGHVPVIFVGRKPSPDDMVRWDKLYYVGTREGEDPTLQGEMAAAWWHSHPQADRNHDTKMQYVIFSGETGKDGELRDAEYCVKALGDAGIKGERLAEIPAGQGGEAEARAAARAAMAQILGKSASRLEFVICDTAASALGVLDALRASGYFRDGRTLPVVARGTDRPILEAVRAGEFLGTVLDDDGRKGQVVYELSEALVRGGEIDDLEWPISDNKYVWVPCRKVTAETAASYMGR